ncbi:hypothetical protein GCM10010275_13780 [Streptomyces litmocidini]|nr:hypothetical protein GCM10010275_13780 [Streptomyces litmocidini]
MAGVGSVERAGPGIEERADGRLLGVMPVLLEEAGDGDRAVDRRGERPHRGDVHAEGTPESGGIDIGGRRGGADLSDVVGQDQVRLAARSRRTRGSGRTAFLLRAFGESAPATMSAGSAHHFVRDRYVFRTRKVRFAE